MNSFDRLLVIGGTATVIGWAFLNIHGHDPAPDPAWMTLPPVATGTTTTPTTTPPTTTPETTTTLPAPPTTIPPVVVDNPFKAELQGIEAGRSTIEVIIDSTILPDADGVTFEINVDETVILDRTPPYRIIVDLEPGDTIQAQWLDNGGEVQVLFEQVPE